MYLSRIIVFPIKSLDGIEVPAARITAGGILENDRIYAMFDQEGKYVNGKRHARVHQLRSIFSPDLQEVSLNSGEQAAASQFVLTETGPINRWLSDFFGFSVSLKLEGQSGFPDDREAFGPTIVGEASLRQLAGWYPGLTLESVRRRFRTNLEIAGEDAPAFCEDRLFDKQGTLLPFQVGSVQFLGHNPCQRCAVPARDPLSGAVTTDFQKEFMKKRHQELPPWAEASRFNHFYRFAVNTSIPPSEAGKTLHIGDLITASKGF